MHVSTLHFLWCQSLNGQGVEVLLVVSRGVILWGQNQVSFLLSSVSQNLPKAASLKALLTKLYAGADLKWATLEEVKTHQGGPF